MKERIEYFDIAKGILILCVVIGHVFDRGVINQYVYSFHVPAFFIISGIMQNYSTMKEKSLKHTFFRKIYTLIVPFLFFEFIGVIFDIIRHGVTLNIFGYTMNTLLLHCNNGPNWFIWALFVSEMLFFLIYYLLKNKYIIWLVSVCIGVLMITNNNLYSTVGLTGVGFLFLVFGYYSSKFFNQNRNVKVLVISGVISVVTCALNGKVDLWAWKVGFIPLYIISALAGTVFVIEGSKFIHSKWLSYYGRNTLTVMGTHHAINLTFKVRAGIETYSFLFGIVVFVILTLLEVGIIWIFNRYIPFLVGKK